MAGKRRDYGTGSLYKRGKRWWIKLYIDKKPHYFPTGTEDKKEAQRQLIKKLGEAHRGELPLQGTPAVGKLLLDYLQRETKRQELGNPGRLAPGTYATYKGQINGHLEPFFRHVLLPDLTTDMLSAYREAREDDLVQQGSNAKEDTKRKGARTVSETTINRELALVRSVLRHYKLRYPESLPSLPVFPMEQEANVRQGFLTEDAFRNRLFPVLPHHLKALVSCAFYAGSRRNEWLMVDWSDVDFANARMYVRKTKNGDPREVPIVRGLMRESLLDAKRRRDEFWPECQAVFSYEGRRLTTFKRSWKTAVTRAGMPGLLFHDMRRSANKNMRDNHVPQALRMAVMGHKTAAMDRRYGIHDRADIDLVGDLLSGDTPKLKRVK